MTETLESAIFSPGDEVLVLLPTESSKMTATWKGPFQIVRKLSDVNYQVNVGASRGLVTYHINLLKRYNRNRVMNIFVEHESVSDMLPDMTIPDVTIGTTLNNTRDNHYGHYVKNFPTFLPHSLVVLTL